VAIKLKMKPAGLANAGAICLVALVLLCLTWELWLAPLRPGGSWLVLKTLPLLAPLPGVLRARRYTFQWSSMLILAYFTEGVVRAMSERGTSAALGIIEVTLSLAFFAVALAYARITRPSLIQKTV